MEMWTKLLGLVVLLASLPTTSADIHSVLIAGSNGFSDYRHQADVAHAYHVLRNHGIKAENIITFMYDDIANNEENPIKGKLFNRPGGKDVYAGVKIDYKGEDVNVKNIMAVLKGDKNGVSGGNKRVLNSTEKDNVFIYFADHGRTGVLAVIDDLWTAEDIQKTLKTMQKDGKYGELVFYVEACYSGTLFNKVLKPEQNILVLTAANTQESSFPTYCKVNITPDVFFDGCLGDEFSVAWMEDSDKENLNKETIDKQFEIVKNRTTKSHVMKFGDTSILKEFVANFQGKEKSSAAIVEDYEQFEYETWPAQDVPINILKSKIARAENSEDKQRFEQQLKQLMDNRRYHDDFSAELIKKILPNKSNKFHKDILTQKSDYIYDLSCHHEAIHAYHSKCFNLGRSPYASRMANALNNLCGNGISASTIIEAIDDHCKSNDAFKTIIL